jgi:cytochrome c-type biogenesis protein CcmF
VSIHHKLREDVYIILTGYEPTTKLANFRVYINPLINWVWIGFGLLMLGTAICLVPQRVVDSLSPRRRTRVGRGLEVGLMVLMVVALSVGFTRLARAQAPAEHEDTSAVITGGHSMAAGVAHECRPDTPTASALMKELVCTCGGCKRETLYECRCGFAAQARCQVLTRLSDARERLTGEGLSGKELDARSYQAVIDSFVEEYGGEHVLSTPKSQLTWLVPYIAIGGGLLLLFAFGRIWVRKGRQAVQARAVESKYQEDEEYAEILDDELRDTD